MESTPVKTKSGKTVYVMDFRGVDLNDVDLHEGYEGLCIACGEFQGGCEPDARRHSCESCESKSVYGLEELLLMGYYKGE